MKQTLWYRMLCCFLCITIMMTGIPITSNAATTNKKFIRSEPQVFSPVTGEKAAISFNLQNNHVVNVMIMDGKQVIAYLAKEKEYKGGYQAHKLTWDGKDQKGKVVKNGTYKVVVEPQDKYKRYRSITTITVVDEKPDISISPNLRGNQYLVYGNKGKKQGIKSVTLAINTKGETEKKIKATVGENEWYVKVPMKSYCLYDITAKREGSSGTAESSISAAVHTVRVTDRPEYLAAAYYGDYKKDAAILKKNGLEGNFQNSGELVGLNLLMLNPRKEIKQEVTSGDHSQNQHLGLIHQLQRTAAMSPLVLTMGNQFYGEEDLVIDGYNPLVLYRSYNSMADSFHEFGMNWNHSFTYFLQDLGNTVIVRFMDGHMEYYKKEEDGTYKSPEGMNRELKKESDGSYTLTVQGTTIYTFFEHGCMKQITDLNGNATVFSYTDGLLSQVKNNGGFFLFYYNKDGSIRSIKDSGNREVTYRYQNGALTEFTDVEGGVTTYEYDSYGRLKKVVSPEKTELCKFVYDASDRVTEKTVKGCTYTYQYNEKGRTIECTEPNGNKTTFRYTSDYRIESVEDLEGVVKYNYEKDLKESLVTDKKASEIKGYALGQTESIEPHSGLKLQTFNMNVCTGDTKYNTLFPQFRIFNTGGGDIDLSDITLRYYYTIDGEAPQNFWCDWSSIGSSNVTGRFVKLKNPVVGADYYLEVGFTANAGKLLPEEPVDLHTRIGKKNWEDFIPGDDYSQNTASALCEFEYVDMFYQGNLVWGKGIISGEEEDGSSGGDVEEPDDGKPDDGKPDDGKPDDGKPDDGKPDDGKPDDGKPDDGKPDDGKPDDGKPDNGKPDDGKPDDGKPDDGKPDDGKPDDGKPDDGKPDDSQGSNEESSEEEIIIPQGLNRLKLKMYNNGNNGSFATVIYPMMKLVNLGENMVKLSHVKIRYYYTADDEKPQNFWCDWSEVGSNAVTGTFHTMEETLDGADSYLEIGFTEEAGHIDIGASIHLNIRFAKEDWSQYDLTNDHSILPGSDYKDWEKVDIFLEDAKIWGEDLVEEAEPLEEGDMEYADDTYTPVRVQMYNQNRESRCNQIAFKFRIYNTQSDPIALSDLRFNYFYTTDGPEKQMFEPDWVGVSNDSVPFIPTSDITCNFTTVDDSNTTTKCVADIGFTREDVFINGGDYVELQVRIHRPEWTKYVQTNDYSFDAKGKKFEDTNKVAVFVQDRWAYGSIPLSYTDRVDLGEEEELETWYEQDSMKGPTSETDKAGNVSKYTYDKNGTVTAVVDPLGNQTVFTYNKWNQITSTTDALGNTTTYEYDDRGNLLSIIDTLGTATNYTYNEKGQPIKVVRADGTIETNTYDSRGNVIQETDGTGTTIQYTYDAFNRVIQKIDATGGITRYEYSPSGNVIKETDPLGYTYVTTYNKDGSILVETDWNKNVTKYQYEKTTGRLKKVIYANAGSETYEYNEMGEISSVTGPDGGTVQYAYDKLGRLIAEVNELGGKTVYTYDSNGNLITEENPEGHTTSYSYDKLNRVIAYTDKDGYKMEIQYDPVGRMIMETDGLGASVHYTYDKLGQLIKMTDAFGNTILYEYDKLGNTIGITDAEGNKTQYEYDAQGRKTKETNALGVVSSWSYDKNGNLIDYTDGRGHHTSYRYDKKNQMRSKIDADGNETCYEYDGCGNLLAETDPLKRRTVYQYDALGNLIKRTDPAGKTIQWEYSLGGLLTKETDAKGNQVSYQYDKGGNQISRTSPNGAITRYAYDKLGRLIQETDALGNQTCYDYDGRGNQIQKTDALGNKKQYVYDGASQLTQVKDELGNQTVYEYDKVGNLIRQTRMGKNAETDQTTRFWYNKVGQLVKTVDPLGERVLYAYDAEGQLIQETAEDNTVVHYQYDKTGNLKKVTYSDGRSVVFEYTTLGQRKTRTDWIGVTSYEYDAGGQLRKTTDSNGRTLEYDWTELGQKQAIHYPDGNMVQYAYDDNANLTKVTDLDGKVTTYEYDEENQRIAKRLPNGATSLYEYDKIGRLIKREEIGKRGTNRYEYGYDKVGNRVKEKRSNTQGSTHENQEEISYFAYDAAGQLTEVSDSNGKRSYTYDAFQNRLKKEEVGKETIEYVYNDRNQLLSAVQDGKEFLYQYDSRGNLKEVRENGIIKQTYTFDSTNLLSKAIVYQNGAENTKVQYTYDGAGIRVGKQVEEEGKTVVDTSYVSDLESPYQNLLMEEDRMSGKTTLFTFAEEPVSMHTDGATSYYRCDEKQSVEEQLDPTGYVQKVISYDEFGMLWKEEDIKAGEPGFAYTSYMLEEQTGLSYAKARYYDAENGRFISEDRYLGDRREATELNRYTYARNNPIRYRDPSGKFVITATLTVSVTSVLVNALVDLAVAAVVVKVGYDVITETNNTINIIKEGEKRKKEKASQGFKGKGQTGKEKAKTRNEKTAGEIIGEEKKGAINNEFPKEWRDSTLDEIEKAAKKGDSKARKAKKLLNDKRFDKGDNRK